MLVVSTRGAVGLPGEDVTDLAGAAVWGLVRSAQTEHPGRIVLVDSDAPLSDTTVAAVLAAGEPQVVVRGETVYIGRVHGSRAVDALLVPPSDEPWRLGMSSKGTFENLVSSPSRTPTRRWSTARSGSRCRTMAANFRDVMIALGLYPDEDAVMGVEASGIVVETASDDTRFAVGDRVTGLFPEGTGTMAITDARLLMEIPTGWSYAEGRDGAGGLRDGLLRADDIWPMSSRASGCWCTPAPAGWAWPRCSWRGTSGWRCSPPPAGVSGTRCGRWVLTTITSVIPARWSSRTSSVR